MFDRIELIQIKLSSASFLFLLFPLFLVFTISIADLSSYRGGAGARRPRLEWAGPGRLEPIRSEARGGGVTACDPNTRARAHPGPARLPGLPAPGSAPPPSWATPPPAPPFPGLRGGGGRCREARAVLDSSPSVPSRATRLPLSPLITAGRLGAEEGGPGGAWAGASHSAASRRASSGMAAAAAVAGAAREEAVPRPAAQSAAAAAESGSSPSRRGRTETSGSRTAT